jgi:imidazolonepropionase
MALKVFENIGELLSLEGAARKDGRRIVEADLSIVEDAALVAENGRLVWVGEKSKLPAEIRAQKPEVVSLEGKTVLPAFVEPHTHLIFAGDRSEEFEWRMQGQSYQEISAKGGGILSTVKRTRAASEAQMLEIAQPRADRFLAQGVTLLEAKSGYGLDLDTELRLLRAARKIQGPQVVTTYLGPHSRSPDFPDLGAYVQFIIDKVLPEIAREKLADRADIYIEKGFYDLELGRRYFEAVARLGLPLTAHVEQLSEFGGTDLALQFKPQSVDHLVYVNENTVRQLAQSATTAVLLPASDFYLKMRYPPARALIDGGARVALSTDFNPGTSPTQDLSFVGVLARIEMKMTLAEVIAAWTYGGASALGYAHELGSLERGKRADFSVFDGSWRELFYSVGHHPLSKVFRNADEAVFRK